MQKSTQPTTKMAAIATSACAPMYVYDANEEHEHWFREQLWDAKKFLASV
jgi:hypothetical protein